MKAPISLLLLLTFLSACASGPSKEELDAEVKRLCAIDGGVKVYETVKLPADKYSRYTQKLTTMPYQNLKDDDEYYVVWEVAKLREGSPSLRRDQFQIVRRFDSKLLGETVSYARRGGDMPGPWHESSFRCPEHADDVFLARRVFIQLNGE
ncbi:hypothetical protein F8A87_08555 [Betaproteobacteria bacterium SCN2]|nr:hypothetical protein F8A87_08555 [Betaproteobacteria bacterium SCN2]